METVEASRQSIFSHLFENDRHTFHTRVAEHAGTVIDIRQKEAQK